MNIKKGDRVMFRYKYKHGVVGDISDREVLDVDYAEDLLKFGWWGWLDLNEIEIVKVIPKVTLMGRIRGWFGK